MRDMVKYNPLPEGVPEDFIVKNDIMKNPMYRRILLFRGVRINEKKKKIYIRDRQTHTPMYNVTKRLKQPRHM